MQSDIEESLPQIKNLNPFNVKYTDDLIYFSPWNHDKNDYPTSPGVYKFLSKAEKKRSIPYKNFSYSINRIGFRGKIPSNKDCIGFFGCSFTFGEGVAEEDIFPNIVSNHLKKEPLNLGMLGYSAQQIIQLFHAANRVYNMTHAVITLPGPERFHYITSQNYHWPIHPNQDRKDREHETVRKALYKYFSDEHLWHTIKDIVVTGELVAKLYGVEVVWGAWHGQTCKIIESVTNQPSLLFEFYPGKDKDIARDNMHPGIEQHLNYAKQVIERINILQ